MCNPVDGRVTISFGCVRVLEPFGILNISTGFDCLSFIGSIVVVHRIKWVRIGNFENSPQTFHLDLFDRFF